MREFASLGSETDGVRHEVTPLQAHKVTPYDNHLYGCSKFVLSTLLNLARSIQWLIQAELRVLTIVGYSDLVEFRCQGRKKSVHMFIRE